MMRIGIYGGSFSPVHNGHLAAARAFMEQMWLDVLYVIPARDPPHKQLDGQVSAAQRLRMCKLAFAGTEGVIVSDMELRRAGKSYTVDTLRELSAPARRLFLLCGTDMLLTLDEWKSPEEIFRLSYPVYVRREDDRTLDAPILEKIDAYNREYGKVVRRIVMPPIPISSAMVRGILAAGGDVSGLVPPPVAAYIAENRLYTGKKGEKDNE